MANKTSKEILKDVLSAEHDVAPKEYEFWVTIPDDMEVPAPLTKKTFEGGLYATYLLSYANHLLKNGIYDDSRFLVEWVNTSEKYEIADDERPSFLEILNYYNLALNYDDIDKRDDMQSDMMCPIKIKK